MEKQQSVFFMITVSEAMARDGLVLRCLSTNKSRFKLVVSEPSSRLLRQTQENEKEKDKGEAGRLALFPTVRSSFVRVFRRTTKLVALFELRGEESRNFGTAACFHGSFQLKI